MSYRIYLSPPDVGPEERAMLLDAFDSNWIAPLGPHVDAFERELAEAAGVGHAAALASGTAGLHLALHMLGVGRGDVVLTSTLTFAATANAIAYVGAEPVFIDATRESWNMDPALLAEELGARARSGTLPKAVVVVDLYGQCADYDAIGAVCARYEVPLIEDAAEALGARYDGRPAGSFGRIAVVSFNGNKILTTSGGGALLADDATLVARARYLASQARQPAVHYEHTEVGYNYRLSNLLAALGRAQLRRLDAFVDRRRANRAFYRHAFSTPIAEGALRLMPEAPRCRSTFWLTCVEIDADAFGATGEEIRGRLARANIEARPVWKPMHLQPVFEGRRVVGGSVAESLFARGLCLPSGSALTNAELEEIADLVLGER